MSPFLGLHTFLAIAIAWLFNLNKFVTIVATYITNPFTIIPIYGLSTWVGAKLLSIQEIVPHIDWDKINFFHILEGMKSLLIPFLVGTFTVGLMFGLLAYIIVYITLKKCKSAFTFSSKMG